MKKLYSLALIALGGIMSANAQSITTLDAGARFGGYMPQAISPNGQYVGGSTFVWAMFLSEWQTGKDYVFLQGLSPSNYENYGAEIRAINDQGIGVGYDDNGGVMVNIKDGEYNLFQPIGKNGVGDALVNGITADGTIIVGAAANMSLYYTAAYWENGTLKYLPIPSDTELGFRTWGSRALCVSNDGSVIVGCVVPDMPTNPMVMWTRQEDGSYVCNPICIEYFNPDLSKEFVWFEPLAMNHNGTKVAMKLMYAVTDRTSPFFETMLLGVYDIATNKVRVVIPDGNHGYTLNSSFDMFLDGISDDGTCVGWGISSIGDRLAFIMYPDEMQPILLSKAFPTVTELVEFDNNGDNLVSGISADGRYICGMYWSNDRGVEVGYVLDTQDNAGVEGILDDAVKDKSVYNLQGVKVADSLEGLPKGIYIVGGKKVAVK